MRRTALTFFIGRLGIFRNIFSINTVILISSAFLLVYFVHSFFETFDGFDKLVFHKGVVRTKSLNELNDESEDNHHEKSYVFQFTVEGDTTTFTTSMFPIGVDNLLEPGDTIEFYTKQVTSGFGNSVSSGNGAVWNTRSPYEVYHLVTNKYEDPIVDFNQYHSDIKKSTWGSLFFALVLFGWYLYRRSGKKSPLVIENWGFD